jgi:hypothetical protein
MKTRPPLSDYVIIVVSIIAVICVLCDLLLWRPG